MSGDKEKYDGWPEWSKHVLIELKRLSDTQDGLRSDLHKMNIEIAMLKVKASVWGAVGASVPLLVFTALQIITTQGH
jgi:hypothetical protein